MGTYAFNPTLVVRNENASLAFRIARQLDYLGTDENDKKKLLAFLKKSDIEKFILFRSENVFNQVNLLYHFSRVSITSHTYV